MDEKLISVTDENAILITVEFIDSGDKRKTGDRNTNIYTIDLIVSNTLTCSELLNAIHLGLFNRLSNSDSNSCLGLCFDSSGNVSSKHDLCRLEKPTLHGNSNVEEIYAQCMTIFCQCYKAYEQPSVDSDVCVGIGSINLKKRMRMKSRAIITRTMMQI